MQVSLNKTYFKGQEKPQKQNNLSQAETNRLNYLKAKHAQIQSMAEGYNAQGLSNAEYAEMQYLIEKQIGSVPCESDTNTQAPVVSTNSIFDVPKHDIYDVPMSTFWGDWAN